MDRWRLPSMACPDCAVAAGGNVSHLAIPFALDASTLADPERPATIERDERGRRRRRVPRPRRDAPAHRRRGTTSWSSARCSTSGAPSCANRATRSPSTSSTRSRAAGLRCTDPDGAASRTAVGVGATVDPSAPAFSDADPTGVYRADLGKAIGAGFSYDQGSGRVGDVQYPYPVLFDVNFNHSKARQLVTYVDWGKYIGTATASSRCSSSRTTPRRGCGPSRRRRGRPRSAACGSSSRPSRS